MPSPIAHSLMGAIFYRFGDKGSALSWRKFFYFIFCANVSDLDFIPGLFVGDVYRFHHGFSHSFLGSFLMALFLHGIYQMCFKDNSWTGFGLVAGAVFSHPILDLFVADPSAPYGCPIFWPLTDARFISPIVFFARTSLRVSPFERINLLSYWIETVVFLPWVVIFYFLRSRKPRFVILGAVLSLLTIVYYGYTVEIKDGVIHFTRLLTGFL